MAENTNGKEKKTYVDHGPIVEAGLHDITSRIKLDANNRALVVWPMYVLEDGTPDFEMLEERYGVKSAYDWVKMAISAGISTRCQYKGSTVEEFQAAADQFKVGQRQPATGGKTKVLNEILANKKAGKMSDEEFIADLKKRGLI